MATGGRLQNHFQGVYAESSVSIDMKLQQGLIGSAEQSRHKDLGGMSYGSQENKTFGTAVALHQR